ncbi:MAG: HD domain-containing protein [Bacteriovoracaceae bacterium]|nr:HD domain-containing protein [Bacteriovoracaceae bacterium]
MNFVPVRLTTLKSQIPFTFDVYVKLPHKYLLYVRNGDDIENESKKRLRKKKVKKLYIEDKDEQAYQQYLDQCLDSYLDDPNASSEDKANFGAGVAESASDDVFEKPQSEQSYKKAKRASSSLVKMLSSNDEVLKTILSRVEQGQGNELDKLKAHAVNSSSLAIRFGEYMGLGVSELEDLGVAALYHDIGYKELSEAGQSLFFKDIKDADVASLSSYKEHPKKAVELLQDKPFAAENVLDLILTHEEKLQGAGFPQKLQKLSLVQEVHSLCCHYDRKITLLGEDSNSVVENIMVDQLGAYSLEVMKKFKKFITALKTD